MRNMRSLIAFYIFIFIITFKTEAQIDSSLSGNVKYQTESGFNELVEKYKKNNYSTATIEGYRVQISTDAGNNAKDISNKVMQEFIATFPDIPAYITYQQPNFKVRCGDFRNKSEARKLQKRISYLYPSAFIVKDVIN
jgi:hypothetical protein